MKTTSQLCPFKKTTHVLHGMVHQQNGSTAPVVKTTEERFSSCIEDCVAYRGADAKGNIDCRRMSK